MTEFSSFFNKIPLPTLRTHHAQTIQKKSIVQSLKYAAHLIASQHI